MFSTNFICVNIGVNWVRNISDRNEKMRINNYMALTHLRISFIFAYVILLKFEFPLYVYYIFLIKT